MTFQSGFPTRGFDFLKDVDVRLSVELGRTDMKLKDVLALGEESIVMLDRLTDELLDVMVNGKIIGSVRGYELDGSVYLRRLVVHPYFRRRGIGARLLKEIEGAFPQARSFEYKTGHQSKRNLYQLEKHGYKVTKTEPFTPAITWVYVEKTRATVAA